MSKARSISKLGDDSITLSSNVTVQTLGVGTSNPEGVVHIDMGDQSANNFNGLVITSNTDSIVTGPDIALIRDSATPAVGDNIGHLLFSGRNSANTRFGYASIFGKIQNPTVGSEDGELRIVVAKDGTTAPSENVSVAKFGASNTVFNPRCLDMDFRVSSDNRENMLYVDASENQVSIGYGNTTIGQALQNQGTLQVYQRNGDANSGIAIDADSNLNSARLYLTSNNNFDISRFATVEVPIIRLTDEAATGATAEFRPEILTQTVIRNSAVADNEQYNRGPTPPMLTIQYSSVGRSYDITPETELVIERGGDARMSLIAPSDSTRSAIQFGDADAEDRGVIAYSHVNESMTFRTNGADSLSIDSGGNLVIPAGKGIVFQRDVGSGSTVSQYLDDYEEGTWTPTSPSSGSISNVAGAYTKVGRVVVLQFYITTSGHTVTQSLGISGLPFTASAGSTSASAVEGTGVCFAEEGLYFVWVQDNSNTMNIVVDRELNGSSDGSENIRGSVTYIAAT